MELLQMFCYTILLLLSRMLGKYGIHMELMAGSLSNGVSVKCVNRVKRVNRVNDMRSASDERSPA